MTDAPNVLVVHRQPEVAERLRAAIALPGLGAYAQVRVDEAGSLADALEILDQCTPVVIFVGLSLPDSEGLATLRSIRSKCQNSPLIVLVRDDDHGTGARAMENGAQDYLYESESRPDAIERAMVRAIGRRKVEEAHADGGRRSGVGETAMGLMHEINNPLAALMLNLEMLKEGGHDDADELLTGIEVAAKRIAAAVRRLEGLRTPRRIPAIGGEAMVDLSGSESGSGATEKKDNESVAAPAPSSGVTILLVDDEESVRAIVTKILTRHGHHILEAEHGADALRLAAGHEGKIDLLISDMYMPGLRGPEILEKLRPSRPGIAVLFMSGYGDEDVARSGVEPGSRFLRKPFTVQELSEAVRATLENSGAD
ncbi:MAG: response regulator [Gemmatimonadaceae bacterium]|nr:response regulator [Gemmatimonadaceae bacterium]